MAHKSWGLTALFHSHKHFGVSVFQYPPAFHFKLAIKYFLQISNEQNHKRNAFCRILTASENNIDN